MHINMKKYLFIAVTVFVFSASFAVTLLYINESRKINEKYLHYFYKFGSIGTDNDKIRKGITKIIGSGAALYQPTAEIILKEEEYPGIGIEIVMRFQAYPESPKRKLHFLYNEEEVGSAEIKGRNEYEIELRVGSQLLNIGNAPILSIRSSRDIGEENSVPINIVLTSLSVYGLR